MQFTPGNRLQIRGMKLPIQSVTMRICMLAEVPGAADSRIFNQASSLKKAGYQVTVIEPGRTGVPALEVVRGLQVLRVFPYRGENGFAPDARALGRRYVRQAGRRAARIEADVYHASGRSALRAAAGAAHRNWRTASGDSRLGR